MPANNFYQVLGLQPNASEKEIKAAYRKLALIYHPDRHGGDKAYEVRFQEIQKAYEVLINSSERAVYDQKQKRRRPGPRPNSGKARRIKVYVDKRIIPLGDSFTVTFTVPSPKAEIVVENLAHFKIIEGPIKRTGLFSHQGVLTVITKVSYELLPLKRGYLPVGPAASLVNGQRFRSGELHVRVVAGPYQRKKGTGIKLKSRSKLAVAACFLLFTLLFFNLVNLEQEPPIEPRSHRHMYDVLQLQNGVAPFDAHFGVGEYDTESYNKIMFTSKHKQDVVVCVVKTSTNEVIRNAYVQANSQHEMRHLPDGFFYIKVYSGKNWSENKELEGADVRGGFAWNEEFKVYDKPSLHVKLNQFTNSEHVFYTDFEITLYAVDKANMAGEFVSSQQFFRRK